MTHIGEEFARAAATKDAVALDRLLSADVDFKGLTPGRVWEASGPEDVASVFFDSWFEPSDTIEALVEVTIGSDVADTQHVSCRPATAPPMAGSVTCASSAPVSASGGDRCRMARFATQ